jgi:hypothetical protein
VAFGQRHRGFTAGKNRRQKTALMHRRIVCHNLQYAVAIL